jgi:GNAT superfamily N-acetyltransferase
MIMDRFSPALVKREPKVERSIAAMAELVMRRATEADVPAIVALLADDELGAKRESLNDIEPYLAAFAAIDADPNQLLVVAELDGKIVGTMQLTFIRGLSHRGAIRSQIEAVRIASDLRGQGHGTTLIAWAIEEARRRNCYLVQLTSNKSRIDAHRFYTRLGFTQSHAGFKLQLH